MSDLATRLSTEFLSRIDCDPSDSGAFFQCVRDKDLTLDMVRQLSWADIIRHRGYLTDHVLGKPDLALYLVGRPECGVFFASEILSSMRCIQLAETPEHETLDSVKPARQAALDIVRMIQQGRLVRTRYDPIEAHSLLKRLCARLDMIGPPWCLDRSVIDPICDAARAEVKAQETKTNIDGVEVSVGDLLDYAAHRDAKVCYHPLHRLASAEKTLKSFLWRPWKGRP